MAVLKTLINNKYDEHVEQLEAGRNRQAELTETELVKSLTQELRWAMGAIAGDSAEQSAAITELESIYDTTITAPTSVVGTTPTSLNTRVGKKVALTAGNNTISFSSALNSADYALNFNCYTANGGMNQWTYDPDDDTAAGFTIHVASAGYITYTAIEA
jgi:hypothetical protein